MMSCSVLAQAADPGGANGFAQCFSADSVPWIVLFGGGMVAVIVSVIVDAVRKTLQTRAREESRREIAAYVAEGSISADDAARLLAAGNSWKDRVKENLGS
jgi:hypothetical protein